MKINYRKFIEDNLTIIDKQSMEVPFKLNKIQAAYYDQMSHKDIILKARQEGFSSFILAIFFTDFMMRPNSNSVVVADKQDNAIALLERVKYYLKAFELTNKTKVPLRFNSKYQLVNAFNNATYTIGTAQESNFGRSRTLTNLHLCVGSDTKILLSNGSSKPMKDILVGDKLISEKGFSTLVTNKWDTGEKDILRIRLWLGNEGIEISPEHKIRVAEVGYNNKLSNPMWKKAKELTVSDYVLWAYPRTGAYVKFLTIKKQKNSIHLKETEKIKIASQTTSNLAIKTDYRLGYLFGYYLAEGHIDKLINKVDFTCHPQEEFYKNFQDIIPKEPKIEIKKDKTGTRKIITYYSKELAIFINKFVGRVEGKCVPEEFLYNYPKDFLRGLYQGWVDGDGSKGAPAQKCITITTIHEKIARQMVQVFALLNHRKLALDYKQDRYRDSVKTKNVYVLREHGFGQKKKSGKKSNVGLRQKYVQTRKDHTTNGFLYIKVRSIEQIAPQQTYEIEVDNLEHSFMTVCGVISNSEAAFYPNLTNMLAGAAQAVVPEGRLVIETTANGFNAFKTLWDDSVANLTSYQPLFFKASMFYSKEFLRVKRRELGESMFMQEYPDTPEEAFITSGAGFFDKDALKYYLDAVKGYKPLSEPHSNIIDELKETQIVG